MANAFDQFDTPTNEFDQFSGGPSTGDTNVFDRFSSGESSPVPAAPPTSTTGAFLRGASTTVLPAIAAGAAGKAGYSAGSKIGSRLGIAAGQILGLGPEDPLADVASAILGVGGAFVGGWIGQTLASKTQDEALKLAAPQLHAQLQQFQQEDLKNHPIASFVGNLAGNLPAFKLQNPLNAARGAGALIKLARGQTVTPIEMGFARNLATQAGLGVGAGVINPLLSGQKPTVGDISQSVAQFLLFGEPRRFGKAEATQTESEKSNATRIQQEQESGGTEYPSGNEGGETPETGGSNRPVGPAPVAGQTPPLPHAETTGIEDNAVDVTDTPIMQIGRVAAMTPDEFVKFVGPEQPGEQSSMTRKARELGMSVTSPHEVAALLNAQKHFKDFRAGFFNQAYQAATGTGGEGAAMSKDPNYKPPFPLTPPTPPVEEVKPVTPVIAPPKPERIVAAALRDVKTGKISTGATHGFAKRDDIDPGGDPNNVGFLTDRGRYVTQDEAERLTGAAGSERMAFAYKNREMKKELIEMYGKKRADEIVKELEAREKIASTGQVPPPLPSELRGPTSIAGPAIKINKKIHSGLEGENHDAIIARVKSELSLPEDKGFNAIRGFVTTDGDFIEDRKKAADIAKEAGQIPNEITELHSEDFWKAKGVPLKTPAAPEGEASRKPLEQSTELGTAGKPNVPPPPKVSRGLRARKIFRSETALNGEDILSFIAGEMRMMSKSEAKKRFKGEKWKFVRDLYDGSAPLKRPWHNIIYDGKSMPDQVAQAAYEAGILREPDVNALWDAIHQASSARATTFKKARSEEKFLQNEADQHTAWMKATEAGKERVTADQLKVGDEVDVEDQRLKVTEIDPDTGDVTLEDGSKFGTQKLESGAMIFVEKLIETPEGDTDFAPEEPTPPTATFKLSAPETVEEQKARLEREAAEAARKKAELDAAEEIRRRSAARLGGNLGSAGQGDLLGGENQDEMFKPKTPKPTAALTPEQAYEAIHDWARRANSLILRMGQVTSPQLGALKKEIIEMGVSLRSKADKLTAKDMQVADELLARADSEILPWHDAGFKTEQAFRDSFQKNRLAENDESEDEFLRRVYCSGGGREILSK